MAAIGDGEGTGRGAHGTGASPPWAISARRYLLLAVLPMLFALPGIFALPPLDRDEARFAQATAQMLESGDFIRIEFQDQPRFKKPIGIHWLQALSVSLFSHVEARQIWAYRLPSLMAAIIAVLATYWGGRRLFGDAVAVMAAAGLAGALEVMAEASIAKTDAALLAATTAAVMAVGRIYMDFKEGDAAPAFRSPGGLALVLWIALGCGILIKGPLAPIVLGLTVFTLAAADGQWRWLARLSPLPGIVIVLVIVLPWSVAIWRATDGAFFRQAFSVDLAPKLAGGQESHGAPFGAFLLAAPLLLWPISLVLVPAAVTAWRERAAPAVRFCLAWIVPMWLVLELTPTKLPHYILPLLPPIALLSAYALRHGPRARWQWIASGGLWLAVTLGLALTLAGATIALGDRPSTLLIAAAVLVMTIAAMAVWSLWRGNAGRAFGAALAASLVLWWSVTLVLVPRLDALNVSPRATAAIAAFRHGDAPIVVAGYAEPSLVFLLGTDTRLLSGGAAAVAFAQTPDGLAVIESRQAEAFADNLARLGKTARVLATIAGLNYSRGERVQLTVYGRDED